MSDIDETREVDDLADSASLRGVVNPLKTRIELSQGKLKMQEHVVYNGQVKVTQAMAGTNGNECTWLYVQAESNNGASLTLTTKQTKQLRDLLDEVLELQGEA
jgi:hypothetical protein